VESNWDFWGRSDARIGRSGGARVWGRLWALRAGEEVGIWMVAAVELVCFPEEVFMGRSFRDSLKVLEADIQHANSL